MRFRFAVFAILALAALLAGRSLEAPGLYYDEAVQARPALELATGQVRAAPLPGSHSVWVGGTRVPLMTQPYMGALKSQVLALPLAISGPDVRVLRAVTLAIALFGIAGIACFARRAFGSGMALITTGLLASDPSVLLLARHDWGSFSISLLLRAAVLFFGFRFFESRRPWHLLLAGFALGLGFYNKVDFGIFVVAVVAGLLLAFPRECLRLVREQRVAVVSGLGAVALGIGPLWLHLRGVLSRPGAFSHEGEMAAKFETLWTTFDGSHFHRLMQSGGLFDDLGGIGDAASGPFVVVLIFAATWAAFRAFAPGGSKADRGTLRFLLVANAFGIATYFLLPGGERIHHAQNLVPLPQLLVAGVLVHLAGIGSGARHGRVPRALAAAGVAIFVALQVGVYEETRRDFSASGGKGRWSNAIADLARDLAAEPLGVTSLDWGFQEPLAFYGTAASLDEAHWRILEPLRRGRAWRQRGDAQQLYLLHLPPFDRSGFGSPFLEAARARVSEGFGQIRFHRDGDGEVAFVSVRFAGDHLIHYDGRFRIERLR